MPSFLELNFGDGAYTFALKLPQILELQRQCGAGIFTIYGRVLKGRYVLASGAPLGVPQECDAYALDVFETIRLGLIGGNAGVVNGEQVAVNVNRARELVEAYCYPPAPLRDAWDTAAAVLSATIEGYDGTHAQKKSRSRRSKASTKARSSTTAESSVSIGSGSPTANMPAP